jgi:hypothetical protein
MIREKLHQKDTPCDNKKNTVANAVEGYISKLDAANNRNSETTRGLFHSNK